MAVSFCEIEIVEFAAPDQRVGALTFEPSLHLTVFVSDHQSPSVYLARAQETEIGYTEKMLYRGGTHCCPTEHSYLQLRQYAYVYSFM